MANKIQIPIDMDSVKKRVAAGETVSAIARSINVNRRTLAHRLQKSSLDESFVDDIPSSELYEKTKPLKTPAALKSSTGTLFEENDDGTASVSSNGERIKTVRQLLASCNVDLEYWEPYDGVVQSYEGMRKAVTKDLEFDEGRITGSVKDQGALTVVTMYKIQVKLRKRAEKTAQELAEYFREQLEKAPPKKFAYILVPKNEKGDDLELATTDVHVGMLAWSKETTFESWNTEKSVKEYLQSGTDLVRRAESYGPLRKITIPFGNDFYNTDNGKMETTRGTSQHDDTRWQHAFTLGAGAIAELAEMLGNKYEVELLLVQGNHDEEKSFYLGEYLRAHFRKHARVSVDNQPCSRKYRLHGCTLVGYEHGHGPKPKELPMIMADEAPPEMWAKARFKEWHHGHIHHEVTHDEGYVTVRWFRALCPQSAWASKKGYRSIRAAQAIRYNDTDGPVDQYNWFPPNYRRL